MSQRQYQFVRQCCAEVGGGSVAAFLAIAGRDESAIRLAAEEFVAAAATEEVVALDGFTWRVLYDTINAAIYALGPAELGTVAGFSLDEAADVQQRICAEVWGAYGRATWSRGQS